MNNKKIIGLLSLLVIFAFASCAPKINQDGLTDKINKILPESILNDMVSMGMPINGGGEPPELEGTYNVSTFVLDSSNIPSDSPGKTFSDFVITFHSFNPRLLTVKITYENGPESGEGIGSYVVGKDNQFTVFCEIKARQFWIYRADAIFVLTGTIVDGGIENFYYANFMVDDHGDKLELWIENGQGRIIYDEDGFSERTDVAKSTPVDVDSKAVSALSK
ncbi:MAG: hypothetical protein U9Q83_12585 [Bacteroidota bacterium]|nr:hypothetical protein [Bacteroidota bacterium]